MTVPLQSTRQCTQDDCPFNETGACLEQVEPIESCPHLVEHYVTDEDEDPESIDESTETPTSLPAKQVRKPPQVFRVPVYSGEALIGEQADALASEVETTVVIVAGDVDSGKTTLIGRSYSSFLEGPVGTWRFAGSRTLLGYERRVHNHRLSSNQNAAVTDHTPLGVDEYYHLDVQSTDGELRRLLLHDISGEAYQQATNSTSGAEALDMLRRADVIVILLDGDRLLKKAKRSAAVSRLQDLLLSIARVGHLKKAPPVQIVVSRWDYVKAADKETGIKEEMEGIRSLVETRLREQKIASPVSICGVASISHNKAVPAGFGFEEVFNFWTELRPKAQPTVNDTLPTEGRQEGWTALKRGDGSGDDHA